MGNNLYDNLRKATNNIDDITTERYATVTKLNGNYCDVKEEDTGLEHTNVPIVNGANLSVGDKVIIGFINNSIYDAVCYGALDKQINDDSKQDLLIVDDSLSTTSTNPVQNKVITGALNEKANSSHTHTKSEITDFPSIPSKTSDLTNDSGFITSSSLPTKTSDLTNDGDGSNVFVKDNDSRLSDARTPLAHTHLSSDVTDLIDVIYPVGSIYMSVNSTNPSVLFGGTWEQIKDTFLLATGDTYANGSTGGEATHTLTKDEMPSHTHTQNAHSHTIGSLARYVITGGGTASVGEGYGNSQNYKTGSTTATNKNTGGGQAHNNMPPYLAVNIWKRTA